MFKKMFGKKGSIDVEDDKKKQKEKAKLQRAQTVDSASMSKRTADDITNSEKKPAAAKPKPAAEAKPKDGGKKKKRKAKKPIESGYFDSSKPLEYPCTPEIVIQYHQANPFLSQNEEWLVVELNEYECLVDNEEIIKIIAKHSKFFEVDPPELWEEFFEFAEDVPSYDEVINYDVWQEFRDVKYPC